MRSYVDGKPHVMLLWRQVADLSLPFILICQWRLSWRRREGQREEDWGVFAPLLLHYGVIPLLKRKIRSSPNYLKPILHFTCLTGWRWGEVERSPDRENLNKSIHAEILWPFNQFFKEVYSVLHSEWWTQEAWALSLSHTSWQPCWWTSPWLTGLIHISTSCHTV